MSNNRAYCPPPSYLTSPPKDIPTLVKETTANLNQEQLELFAKEVLKEMFNRVQVKEEEE